MHSTQSHVGIAKKVNKKKQQQQQSYNVAGKVHVITWKPFGPSRSENFTNMYTLIKTLFFLLDCFATDMYMYALSVTFMPPVPPVMSSSLLWLNTMHNTECISADTEKTSWKFRLKT